ncbi:MAG: hypothetical protein LQ338_008284 [Usnochroma carphineum]|nr:MAG: hypothetical protein LQ338_008284 [Usnochroma carphineum]
MICHRCLHLRLHASHTRTLSNPLRLFSASTASLEPQSPPAATSTSAAQPFSTPFTPSPSKSTDPTKTATSPIPKSSLKAGTPLRGLAFLKNKEPPVAKEDDEYPTWLWGLLDQGKFGAKAAQDGEAGGGGGGDLFCKSSSSLSSITPSILPAY